MVTKMSEVSLKHSSLADLGALAAGLGDSALQERADELREMVDHSAVGEGLRPLPKSWEPAEGLPYEDHALALHLKKAWAELYGPDVSLWPENLRDALETINASVGFANFDQNLSSAFQNLRLYEETVAALEAGVAIVGEGLRPLPLGSPQRGSPTQWGEGFIPESAARAGLSFISSPFTLIAPIWMGSLAGRAVTGLTANAGRALSLTDEAIVGAATLFGLFGEAAGFVATSRVIASVAKQSSEDTLAHGIASVASLLRNDIASGDMLTETFASTLFFGMLRASGAAGRFVSGMMPRGETGIALAKLTGHTASVLGLATTEEVQEKINIVGEGLSPLPPREPAEGLPYVLRAAAEGRPYADERTFTAKLWRALFLHTAINAVNGVVNLDGAQSDYARIRASAEEIQNTLVIPAVVSAVPAASYWRGDLVSSLDSRFRGNDNAVAGRSGLTEDILQAVLKMAMAGEKDDRQKATPAPTEPTRATVSTGKSQLVKPDNISDGSVAKYNPSWLIPMVSHHGDGSHKSGC